jgi:hypothetical protein
MSDIWAEWKNDAAKAGVPEDLAQLGHDVLRQNYERGWGLEDGELAAGDLLAIAHEAPDFARRRWTQLLKTNGGQK